MTTVDAPPQTPKQGFDPDDFRMTIGEHLEDLRKRLILGLVGLAVAMIGCMVYADDVLAILCRPLVRGLQKHHFSSQMMTKGITEGFMTYLQVSIICGIIIAGPWMVYQLWLFVAAGLYPHERKTVTKYIPLSIALMLSGVLFVYFLVLPLTVNFFLTFTSGIPLPGGPSPIVNVTIAPAFPLLDGDPADPPDGAVWYNKVQDRLKIRVMSETRVVPFGPEKLLTPQITLDEYISFVLTFMLVFAVAFQLPLVLLALVRIGIIDIEFLRKQRKIVWFVMTIVAAVIAPGDVVTSMVALLIPLILLYEFGIWLAQYGEKQRRAEEAAEAAEDSNETHD
jgi:sec-independent protein translocase protein TatC